MKHEAQRDNIYKYIFSMCVCVCVCERETQIESHFLPSDSGVRSQFAEAHRCGEASVKTRNPKWRHPCACIYADVRVRVCARICVCACACVCICACVYTRIKELISQIAGSTRGTKETSNKIFVSQPHHTSLHTVHVILHYRDVIICTNQDPVR